MRKGLKPIAVAEEFGDHWASFPIDVVAAVTTEAPQARLLIPNLLATPPQGLQKFSGIIGRQVI